MWVSLWEEIEMSSGLQMNMKAQIKTTRRGFPRRVVFGSRLKGFQCVSVSQISERKQRWPE
jgi:hypothetical protein